MPEVPPAGPLDPGDRRPDEQQSEGQDAPLRPPQPTSEPEQPLPRRSGPFGPPDPAAASPPQPDGATGAPSPPPRPMPVHMQPPAGDVPPAEPASTTGVPHYAPPATTDRLFGAPAAATAGAGAVPAEKRSVFRPLGRGLREIAETIILALLIFLLVRAVVQNFQVEGRSMNPTFEHGWYVLVNKALYWEVNLDTVSKFVPFVDPGDDPTRYIFRGPKRGDVIVFRSPTQGDGEPERDFIKRVIGLPGETVEIRDCTVFVDGLPLLNEPYIEELPHYTYGPETVPPDHYFVLGDNRNNSSDSHSWGMLPKENIIGQAWLIYWPRSAFGLVDNTSLTPMEPEPLPEPFADLSPARCPGS